MTQVAARHGYADASVARVVEQAGVSRATFYEHFADKEACFLAAFQLAAERLGLAMERIDSDVVPGRRAAEMLDHLLVNIDRPPGRGAPAPGRGAGRRAAGASGPRAMMLIVEGTVERWLSLPDENGVHLAISGRAVMVGISGILVARAFRGETAQLGDLRGDLLAWVNSHAVPEGRSRLHAGAVAPARAPAWCRGPGQVGSQPPPASARQECRRPGGGRRRAARTDPRGGGAAGADEGIHGDDRRRHRQGGRGHPRGLLRALQEQGRRLPRHPDLPAWRRPSRWPPPASSSARTGRSGSGTGSRRCSATSPCSPTSSTST